MKSRYTPNEKRIINLLFVARRPLTTRQISQKLEIAWQTAKDNLADLRNKGVVKMNDIGSRIYWNLLFDED